MTCTTGPSAGPVAETPVWEAGLAYDTRGAPLPPVEVVICDTGDTCRDYYPGPQDAAAELHASAEAWAAAHAARTGHRDYVKTTTCRLRAVIVAYEPREQKEAGTP